MRTTNKALLLLILIGLTFGSLPIQAQKNRERISTEGSALDRANVLWREPTDIAGRNLFFGIGGADRGPGHKFSFVKEDTEGSNPKFEVKDENGVKWKVKLGPEAQSETAATRIVWAVGYFTDEDYYLPEIQVDGLKKLKRGNSFLSNDGRARGARLERVVEKGEGKKTWNWFDNPFIKTRELNGLKVLMALVNNWDLKEVNNKEFSTQENGNKYVVTDLGATFGKTGNTLSRSRNNLKDYQGSKFIHKITDEDVDFVMHSRPFFLFAFNFPYYRERTKMEKIVHHIPRADARWIGQWLARLSDTQLGDAFRSAGYSPEQVDGFVATVKSRIAQLNQL